MAPFSGRIKMDFVQGKWIDCKKTSWDTLRRRIPSSISHKERPSWLVVADKTFTSKRLELKSFNQLCASLADCALFNPLRQTSPSHQALDSGLCQFWPQMPASFGNQTGLLQALEGGVQALVCEVWKANLLMAQDFRITAAKCREEKTASKVTRVQPRKNKAATQP